MKRLAIALLALTSLVSAKPTFLPLPLTYEILTPGAQVDANNGALDNSEAAVAGTQYMLDDRVNLAVNEASQPLRLRQSSSHINNGPSTLTSTAPLGADGRVVDTAEVAAAKAAHAAAHVNERLNLVNEAARSAAAGVSDSSEIADNSPVSPDDRILDTSEVTGAHVNEKINPASEAARSGDALTRIADGSGAVVPLVLGNGVIVTALVPVDPAGRLTDSLEMPVNGNRNQANDVKTVDALAVAGPALAYGRLVY